MDDSKLRMILEKFDLIEDPVKLDNEKKYSHIIHFLRNFAKFLRFFEGNEKTFLMLKDLADISSDPKKYKSSYEPIVLDFKKAIDKFRSMLPRNTDVNYCILELFSNCLIYIINQIHGEPENLMDIYQHFLNMEECIIIFSDTTIIIDSRGFKNAVSFFIADLMKIVTVSELSIKRPNVLKVCDLIRKMLTELSKIIIYRDLILRQILKKLKCAMSYFKANANFDGYVTSHTFVIEYFLWVIKTTLNDSHSMGSKLEDRVVVEMKEVLDNLKICLKNRLSFTVMNLLETIILAL